MTGNEYQKLAMRTNDGKCSNRMLDTVRRGTTKKVVNQETGEEWMVDVGGILNASLGLSGEVGEVNDMIKKWMFHDHELDIEHMRKEIGDVCWYIAMMCESLGIALERVMQDNINKLKARYPEGFDTDKSKHRAEGDI